MKLLNVPIFLSLLFIGCAQVGLTVDAFNIDSTADTTSTSDTVTCSGTITSVSPARVGCVIKSPTRRQTEDCEDTIPDGNDWSCVITLPAYSEAGQWDVVDFWAEVGSDRAHAYTGSLRGQGFSTGVTVTSPSQDVTSPSVTAVSAIGERFPDSIGLCTVTANDSPAGLKLTGCNFEGPSGGVLYCSDTPSSCSFNIPADANTGTWTTTNYFAVDNVGNKTVVTGSPATFEVEDEALLLHWDFSDDCLDGTVDDVSGNGRTGSCPVGVPVHVPGDGRPNLDGALDFNGNDVVLFSNAYTSRYLNLTFSLWIKSSASEVTNATFMGTTTNILRQDGVTGTVESSITSDDLSNPSSALDQQWHHVAVTVDMTDPSNGVRRVYVDGVYVEEVWSGAIAADTGSLIVGSNSALTSDWNGLLDDVRMYNYALSESEIQALANASPATLPLVSVGERHAVQLSGDVAATGVSTLLTNAPVANRTVPFVTREATGTVKLESVQVDVQLTSTDVIVARDSVESTVDAEVSVLTFDPSEVVVHSGRWHLDDADSTITINSACTGYVNADPTNCDPMPASIDASKSFPLVYSYQNSGSAEYGAHMLEANLDSNQLTVSRTWTSTVGTVDGTYYIVEGLGTGISVQEVSATISTGTASATTQVFTPVPSNTTFLVGSYQMDLNSGSPSIGAVDIYASDEVGADGDLDTVTITRDATDASTISWTGYLVTLNDGSTVERGTFADLSVSNTDTVSAGADMAIVAGTFGNTSAGRGNVSLTQDSVRLSIVGTTLTADHAGGALTLSWEAINWAGFDMGN